MAAFFGTLILFVGVLGFRAVSAYGRMRDRAAAAPPVPGEAEFRAANRAIIRLKERAYSGNSPEAIRLAGRFSELIEDARKNGFSAANRDSFSLSKHRFLTHCQLNADSCAFLVHVPELRRYTEDAQTSISQIAWMIGHSLAQDAGLPPSTRLAVGVKGMLNYEAVFIGDIATPESPLDDIEVEDRGLDLAKIRLLYPFFAHANTATEETGQGGEDAPASSATLPALAPLPGPVPYSDYSGLLGEEFQGEVFLIELHQRRWAVMSRHQFEGRAAPRLAEDIDSDLSVALQSAAVVRQRDVQLIPVADQSLPLPYLAFEPVFELEAGEKLWIERGAGEAGTSATLLSTGLKHGVYNSLDGPASLTLRLDTPADVRGASGSPIIRLKTGLPVGVLLSADRGDAATTLTFEPICVVGKISGPPLEDAALAAKIPGVWTEDFTRFGRKVTTSMHLRPDGTYFSALPPGTAPGVEPITITGRWRIEDAKLIYFDLQASRPDFPADPISDQIVHDGGDHLVYRSADGVLLLMRKTSPRPHASP